MKAKVKSNMKKMPQRKAVSYAYGPKKKSKVKRNSK